MRRALNAHAKHGYGPIAMRDLYGVPLPYSKLDDEIEQLFGPTVVRRKLLVESSESLDPVRPLDGVLWASVSRAGGLSFGLSARAGGALLWRCEHAGNRRGRDGY